MLGLQIPAAGGGQTRSPKPLVGDRWLVAKQAAQQTEAPLLQEASPNMDPFSADLHPSSLPLWSVSLGQ